MKLTPKPHQLEAEEWMEGRDKFLLDLDMGLGKSMLGVRSIKDGERVLIIPPATLKINWRKEIKMWSNIDKIFIAKTKKDVLPEGPGVVIMNYDLLGSSELVSKNSKAKKPRKRTVANFDFKDFDRVIVDESQMIKNPKASRTKIASKIIKNCEYAVLLSGTPMERAIDLYVPLFAMGATDMSYDAFGEKFGDPKLIHIGQRTVWQYRGLTNPEQLKELMKEYILVMKKEDVIDLPERDISVVSLDLPLSRQEKTYDFAAIKKDPRPIGFEGLSELIHEQGLRKLPLAIRHIKMRFESMDKIFVTAKHRDVLDILAEKLKDFNPVRVQGGMSSQQKEDAVHTFQTDVGCRLMLGQTKAAGVGITLTAASHVIMVEPDWSFSAIMQIIDRCHRIGQKNNVTGELLTVSNSIDERMLYTTLEKEGYQNTLGL